MLIIKDGFCLNWEVLDHVPNSRKIASRGNTVYYTVGENEIIYKTTGWEKMGRIQLLEIVSLG